jgi:hypothetical protein
MQLLSCLSLSPNTQLSCTQYKAPKPHSTPNRRLLAYLVINTCRVAEVNESAMNQVDSDITLPLARSHG